MSLKRGIGNLLVALTRLIAIPTVLVAVAALVMVVPAFAMEEPCWADFNLEDCEPEDGTLVIDVTQDVANDIDSAVGGGYWASDFYTRHIRVWDFEEDPLVVVQYDGIFVTVDGPSPNDTGEVGAGVIGTMTGGYVAWFDADLLDVFLWPTEGYVGSFDYEGNPETGEVYPVSWLEQYFEEWWNWEYEWWGWMYTSVCPSNGYWINSQDGNEGDAAHPLHRSLPFRRSGR